MITSNEIIIAHNKDKKRVLHDLDTGYCYVYTYGENGEVRMNVSEPEEIKGELDRI